MKTTLILLVISAVLGVVGISQAQTAHEEEITLSTYYPAPYGEYEELVVSGKTSLAVNSGNVGIGVPAAPASSPSAKLEVMSNTIPIAGDQVDRTISIKAKDAFGGMQNNSPGISFLDSSGTDRGALGVAGWVGAWSASASLGDIVLRSTSGGNLIFATSTQPLQGVVPRLYIKNGGNIGIGTDNPTDKLDVLGNILVGNNIDPNVHSLKGTQGVEVIGDDNVLTLHVLGSYRWSLHTRKDNGHFQICNTNDTVPYALDGYTDNRTVWFEIAPTGESYNKHGILTCSDIRLKEDIEPLSNPLAKLSQLQGIRFNWKDNNAKGASSLKHKDIGIIAQDMEKVFPEIVGEDSEGYKAVSYEKFTVVLLEAIKAQQKEIAELRSQIQG